MGIFGSSEEKVDQKTVESTGHVNNNVVIQQQARDVHTAAELNVKMLYTMYFMCAVELFKIGTYIYVKFRKNLKKKYENQNNANRN